MPVAGAADAVGVGGGVFYEVGEAVDGAGDEGVEGGIGDGEAPVVEGGAGVDLWLLVRLDGGAERHGIERGRS